MMREKPRIGISARNDSQQPWQSFARAVHAAGGEPVLLTPELKERFAALGLAGLILPGGGDLLPAAYHAPERAQPRFPWPERDELEISLCQWAQESSLPLLGVCRGMQVMVVAAGGTLVQDIATELPEVLAHEAPVGMTDCGHLISIAPASKLAAILGTNALFVNSSHHQAPQNLGTGLEVCARSMDGLIEAVERPDATFFLGVQWHPERIWEDSPIQRRLIEALVNS